MKIPINPLEYLRRTAGLPARLAGEGMDSPRKLVFLSYVEEDGDVAHAIAEGLEAKDYSTWYYERDCPTGADYFEETYKAISDCDAMIVLISPRSLPSDQITREIVRAVESSKATLPLLLDVSHDEYAKRRPGWKQAMAASNATRVSVDRIPTIIPALVAGLNAKGIRATNGLSTTNLQAPPANMERRRDVGHACRSQRGSGQQERHRPLESFRSFRRRGICFELSGRCSDYRHAHWFYRVFSGSGRPNSQPRRECFRDYTCLAARINPSPSSCARHGRVSSSTSRPARKMLI